MICHSSHSAYSLLQSVQIQNFVALCLTRRNTFRVQVRDAFLELIVFLEITCLFKVLLSYSHTILLAAVSYPRIFSVHLSPRFMINVCIEYVVICVRRHGCHPLVVLYSPRGIGTRWFRL